MLIAMTMVQNLLGETNLNSRPVIFAGLKSCQLNAEAQKHMQLVALMHAHLVPEPLALLATVRREQLVKPEPDWMMVMALG